MPEPAEAMFVLAPRYARDIAASLRSGGIDAQVSTRAADAGAAFSAGAARVAIIDARGALATGLVVAHEIGLAVEARHGALLVLLARSDTGAVEAAYAAGATQVLASPFTAADLIEAVRFAQRMAARLEDAAAGRAVTVENDATQRDMLTGLASAQHAQVWVELLLGGAGVGEPAVIVMLVAVGRFGQINAAYGRTVADFLLVAAAERLRELVMPADGGIGDGWLVARMAGAEFAVVLPSPVTLVEANRLAEDIVAAFDAPFEVDARVIHLAIRIGISYGGGSEAAAADGPGLVFQRASAALSVARAGAPGSIEAFHALPGDQSLTRIADLESDLRRAIASGEFEILYQPQVALGTGHICGVEALVRWAHPVFGQLSATTLLEVAASAEFATQLGRHIRSQALHEAAAWPRSLDALHLSVNVTAGDLRAPDFVDSVEAALASSGFPRHRLTLEVTESELIENLDVAAQTLGILRDRGSSIALDDFGTGYSSLAYLKALPLDYLKLDKSLTTDLAGQARDRVVVHGVVSMARALGILVIAEGVETARHLELVAAARCDWYQGYLCSVPLRGAALAGFVAAWNAESAGVEPAPATV